MSKLYYRAKYWLIAFGATFASFAFAVAAKAQTAAAASSAGSDTTSAIGSAINQYIISPLVSLLGQVVLILVDFLIKVVSYTAYANSPAVSTGWIVVRDIANMFFVAMFLVIAIGTIVNPGKFQGMRAVVRLLLYALFVNFSKTIVLLCVDASNIVMLTFVNGFKAAAGGNFVDALGMKSLVTLSPNSGSLGLAGLIGAQFLALIMMVIMVVLIGIILIAMVMRVVTLWFLIVVSPLAFAMGGTEFTKPRYAEWWKRFSAQLTTGPLVAFFLWLTLAVVQQQPTGADIAGTGAGSISGAASAGAGTTISCGPSGFCQEPVIMRFVIAALMLLGGLMFAKEFEGVGGELAGAAWNKGKGAVDYVGKRALKGAALGVGIAATGGVGAVVAGGYLASRTNTGKGVIGRAGTGFGRGISNLQARGGVIGAIAKYAPGLSMAGRAATSYGNKQLAEADKKSRERLANLSQAQIEEIASSRLSSYPDQRAAALHIAKDRDYRTANPLNADGSRNEEGARRFATLQNSMRILDDINGDKEVEDAVKVVRDVRPEALDQSRTPVNYANLGQGFKPREDGKNLRLDLMSEANRNTFLQNMRPDDLDQLYTRYTDARGKSAIDAFRMGTTQTPQQIQQALVAGTLNVETAPAERFVQGTAPGPNRPRELNTDLATTVLQHGTPQQVRAFLERHDIDRFRDAMRDALRTNVNLNDPTNAGFDAANARMTDENVHLAESAVIAGNGVADTYHMRDNGNFTDPRMQASFERSQEVMSADPARKAEFLLKLPDTALAPNPQTGETSELAVSVVNQLSRNDLLALARRAQTGPEQNKLRNILRSIQAVERDATKDAVVRQRASAASFVASRDREIVRFMGP